MPVLTEDLDKAIAEVIGTFDGVVDGKCGTKRGIVAPQRFRPETKSRGGTLADAFPVVASLPPKNSVCEPERQNDFRDVKPF